MFKQVFLYDGTPYLAFKGNDGEYQYPDDEWTEIAPPEGIYSPFYFNGNEWVGSTRSEWLSTLPKEELISNSKDELNFQLIMNDLEQNSKIETLQQDIVNLTNQLLKIQGEMKDVLNS